MRNICGIENAGDIAKAARLMAGLKPMALYYSMGITQFVSGVNGVKSTANLQMLSRQYGSCRRRRNPLRGQNNVQGACDMGCLPASYPGLSARGKRKATGKKFETAWGVTDLPMKPGLTLVEMMNAAHAGDVKAMYIMGENPVLSDPNQQHVIEALERTRTSSWSRISFLPRPRSTRMWCSPRPRFLEKEGTVTNTERRVQPMHRVLPDGGIAKDDWWITLQIARRMGADWEYEKAKDIFEEIRKVTPSYAGITYERIEKELIQWPCPTTEPSRNPVPPQRHLLKGPGAFQRHRIYAPRRGDGQRVPAHAHHRAHTRTFPFRHDDTEFENSMMQIAPEGFVEVNPDDAANLNIEDGEMVSVSTRRGSIRIKAKVASRLEAQCGLHPLPFLRIMRKQADLGLPRPSLQNTGVQGLLRED